MDKALVRPPLLLLLLVLHHSLPSPLFSSLLLLLHLALLLPFLPLPAHVTGPQAARQDNVTYMNVLVSDMGAKRCSPRVWMPRHASASAGRLWVKRGSVPLHREHQPGLTLCSPLGGWRGGEEQREELRGTAAVVLRQVEEEWRGAGGACTQLS